MAFIAKISFPTRAAHEKAHALSGTAIILRTAAIAQTSSSGSTKTQTTSEPKALTSLPRSSILISEVYKQSVYDPHQQQDRVEDILPSPDGRTSALIIGAGGFLGIGERDVAVPFNAVKPTTKDNRTYLTLDTTKGAESAAGFRYDRQKSAWVPLRRANRY